MRRPRSMPSRPTLIAMAMLLASSAEGQNSAPAELQGTWVPTKAACESSARVVVGANQLTLVNGSDKEVVGGAEMAGPRSP